MQVVLQVETRRGKQIFGSSSNFLTGFFGLAVLMAGPVLCAQNPPAEDPHVIQAPSAGTVLAVPIAIVPLDSKNPDKAAKVTGALEVSQGRAVIATNGTITSGTETTQVTLPRRGTLRVCASTTINLAADSSVPAGETPGLMMAMDHGAVEASFATGRNSDILLTPDFRILIGGPGSAEVRVRLGEHGDTCVDNAGFNAPYVLVISVFDSGSYRVQAGQRVMFQHGNVHEVVDQEKEPCGCPPAAAQGNEFPLAQSEGVAATPAPGPSVAKPSGDAAPPVEPLIYSSPSQSAPPAVEAKPAPATVAEPAAQPKAAKKKSGFFRSAGRFFRRIFGAES
jgi:hypothetical protein